MTFEEWIKNTPADYYACDDPEQLTHEDATEAVLEQIENCDFDDEQDFAEYWYKEDTSISVTAYERNKISDKEMKRWADQALENISEAIEEEYGSQDGDHEVIDVAKFEGRMLELVQAMVKESRVWGCSPSSEYTLTDDEVIALMRKERPEWFKSNGDEVPE